MPAIQCLTMTYDALNEDGTFSEGDTVTGRVTLVLMKETTAQRFYVKVKGEANVRWDRKSGKNTHTYSSSRRYFKLKQMFVPENMTDTIIPKGVHTYDFSFAIPRKSMPSTYHGNHGKIVYTLTVNLSRSYRWDRTVEKELKFVSKFVPNLQALISRQVGRANKKDFFFFKGGVHMEAVIDRRAFAPGETVAVVAKVNNTSSSDMTPKFILTQTVVYHANGNRKTEEHTVKKVVESCLMPETEREIRCAIKIPSDQILSIQNCDILSVEYCLKVYLDVTLAFNPEVLFPLVIVSPDLVSGFQHGAPQATGGPSNTDFPPSPVRVRSHPASPRSGRNRYGGASGFSTLPSAHPNRLMYVGPHAAPPTSLPASPYGSPFLSSPSSTVLHPPPSAPSTFCFTQIIEPRAPPAPSAPPAFNISPTPPAYNLLSAPLTNTDFLSQSDEAPPAYSLLFPSSETDSDRNK